MDRLGRRPGGCAHRKLSGDGPLEVVSHLTRVLVALLRVLLHGLGHDRLDLPRDRRIEPGDRLRLLGEVLGGHGHR
jgi:hypothetical protein